MNRLLLLALLIGPVVLPDLAQAASADGDADSLPGLSEIIVSAEKRQVDLRESPQANLSGTVTVPACSITLFRIPVALDSQ